MEKRFIGALLVSILVIWAWSTFLAPAPPIKRPENDPTSRPGAQEGGAAGGAATSAPSGSLSGGVGATTQATSMPMSAAVRLDSPEPRRTIVLSSPTLTLEIDTQGAIIRTAKLQEFLAEAKSPADGDKLRLIETFADSPGALSLRDDDWPDDGFLDREVWTVTESAADSTSVALALQIEEGRPGATKRRWQLTKTVSLNDEPHRATVKLALRPLEGGALDFTKKLWMRTSGGVYLPEEQATFASRSMLVDSSAAGREVIAKSVKDISGLDAHAFDLAGKSCVTAGDLATYFGAYMTLQTRDLAFGGRIRALERPQMSHDTDGPGPPRTYSELGCLLMVSQGRDSVAAVYDYYLGPKDHRYIKESYGEGENREIYLEVADHELTAQDACCGVGFLDTIIHGVSKVVLLGLSFYQSVFGNVGLAIICLTFTVRLILFPVNRRSQAAMQRHGMKMTKLKPKLDALKEKHKDDKQAYAQEQFKLMKAEKVGFVPLGGCLPMVLQIPIFFGLFSAIRFDVDLRHAPFLWAADLSRPDNLLSWTPWHLPCCIGNGLLIDGLNLLPLLMTVAWFIDAKMTPITSDDPQLRQQQKMMMYMPFLFGLMLYGYAAGLSLYWLTSSLVGIFEKRVIKRFFPVTLEEPSKSK